jgi:hypothetical protein
LGVFPVSPVPVTSFLPCSSTNTDTGTDKLEGD